MYMCVRHMCIYIYIYIYIFAGPLGPGRGRATPDRVRAFKSRFNSLFSVPPILLSSRQACHPINFSLFS